jgi:hypothetical protein
VDDERVSNEDFARENSHFLTCCSKANVKNTTRQAAKFRNKYGAAYLEHKKIADGNKHKAAEGVA